jgi:hypothetical protein
MTEIAFGAGSWVQIVSLADHVAEGVRTVHMKRRMRSRESLNGRCVEVAQGERAGWKGYDDAGSTADQLSDSTTPSVERTTVDSSPPLGCLRNFARTSFSDLNFLRPIGVTDAWSIRRW